MKRNTLKVSKTKA